METQREYYVSLNETASDAVYESCHVLAQSGVPWKIIQTSYLYYNLLLF